MVNDVYTGKTYVKQLTSSLKKTFVLEIIMGGIKVHSELKASNGVMMSQTTKKFKLTAKAPTYELLVKEIEKYYALS